MTISQQPNKKNQDLWGEEKRSSGLPKGTGIILTVALVVSLGMHILSGISLPYGGGTGLNRPLVKKDPKIKIKINPVKKKPEVDPQKILEAMQEKTEKPVVPSRLGQVDHKTEKETKVKKQKQQEKALDPGLVGKKEGKKQKQVAQPKSDPKKSQILTNPNGTVAIKQNEKRKAYESLLPTMPTDLAGQVKAGYQDFIDEEIEEGDRIDLNTTEYRYIGYMTNMRKAIELVWNYPFEASSKGLQGEVGLEFAIQKDGRASRIKVIRSSGYAVLDDAIVQAIKLASPFSPLPDGMDKNRLIITGSFRYQLTAYGGH